MKSSLRFLKQFLTRQRFFFFFSLISFSIFLSGCQQQGDERLKEKAAIEHKAGLEEQYRKLDERATSFQKEILQRHRFNQAISGTYKGILTELPPTSSVLEGGPAGSEFPKEFGVQLILTPKWSYSPSDGRVRSMEELNLELSQLFLNVQFRPELASRSGAAVGCSFSEVRPDLLNGHINLMSETCPSAVRIKLASLQETSESQMGSMSGLEIFKFLKSRTFQVNSSGLASKILSGESNRVSALSGLVDPNQRAVTYELKMIRVSDL